MTTALDATHGLLHHFTEPVLVLDQNWRAIYTNPRAERLLRKDASALYGTTPWAHWPAPARISAEQDHKRALEEQVPVQLPAGPQQWIELRAFSCDEGIVVSYHDISQYKHTEQELLQSKNDLQGPLSELQERLAAIVESSDDAILSKDLNGIIQSWNRGAERIFGYKADEIVGKHISTLAVPDTIDEIPGILSRIARGESVDHYRTKRKTKDGRVLNISLTVSPVRDASGKISGASKVARDVTEREEHEQALREANAALTRSNADLQQFAYSASHDLQEPLRMVSTYSEMLRKYFGGKLGPAGEEYIGYTIQGALRMEQLLSDLRAYAQASTADLEPPRDIEAGAMLERALANLQTAIADSDASVTHAELPRIRMHEFQLQQLFQNLMGNAIRYRSGERPQIHVAAEQRGREWLFSVRDNGIGIDPEYKEQIFGIFQRLHSAAEYPGTGMGLAICQRVVERAGGRIWVDSERGRGATFFFTVPCAN